LTVLEAQAEPGLDFARDECPAADRESAADVAYSAPALAVLACKTTTPDLTKRAPRGTVPVAGQMPAWPKKRMQLLSMTSVS